jgi:hypothetical protein
VTMDKIPGSAPFGSAPGATPEGPPPSLTRREFVRALLSRGSLAVGAFFVGFGIDWTWARLVRGRRLQRTNYPRLILGSYRVHHSLVGYLAVLVGLFFYPAILIPLGLGIIVGHGRRDGPWGFIERVDRD